MEIHHPSHPMHQKNWKEYFLEFFMLFLAVFLGFVAENLREHIADKDKEKRNIANIIKSISLDTGQLARLIKLNRKQISGLDSFILIHHENIASPAIKWKYYYYILNYGTATPYFFPNSSGMEQLKSAGGLSLIKDESVVDSIERYDDYNKTINEQQQDTHYELIQLNDLYMKIADLSVMKDPSVPWIGNADHSSDSVLKKLPNINNDPVLLRQFFGYITGLSVTRDYYVNRLEKQLQRGTNLIDFLKRRYDLNNE